MKRMSLRLTVRQNAFWLRFHNTFATGAQEVNVFGNQCCGNKKTVSAVTTGGEINRTCSQSVTERYVYFLTCPLFYPIIHPTPALGAHSYVSPSIHPHPTHHLIHSLCIPVSLIIHLFVYYSTQMLGYPRHFRKKLLATKTSEGRKSSEMSQLVE